MFSHKLNVFFPTEFLREVYVGFSVITENIIPMPIYGHKVLKAQVQEDSGTAKLDE